MSTTRLVPRYAHTPGLTYLTYTPNGRHLLTVGSNNVARKFTVGSDDEPVNIDQSQDANTGIAASNDRFVTCSEDGTVTSYSMTTNDVESLLGRFPLPTRDVAISPDGSWVAVSSDETFVKVINIKNTLQSIILREQTKAVKHITYHPTGNYIANSSIDGCIYVYSLSSEEPELIKKLEDLIPEHLIDDEASCKAVWHPDGRAFAVATSEKDIAIISRSDWTKQKSFSSGHESDITDLTWSPNGSLLASAGMDGKLLIWETKTQTIVARHEHKNIVCLAWHPTENAISFTTNQGQLFTLPKPVPESHEALLKKSIQAAPLLNDEQQTIRTERPQTKNGASTLQRRRSPDRDSVDDLFGGNEEVEDWLEDDDGAGYGETNANGKRSAGPLESLSLNKRHAYSAWSPEIHEPFQPGSTPWRGSRRYLHLNLIGFVWTVDQETHNTVTVEFYDRETYRDFHFTDHSLFDKACLNEHGTLFAGPSTKGNPAAIFYRPHETWTARADWRVCLPEGEEIISVALSTTHIVVCTSTGYVRMYTLHGVPFKVYRQKSMPVVSCATWRDYVLIMGNGAVGHDGKTQLVYSIENVKRDEVFQENDIVALPEAVTVKNVFFSETGDPMIYTTDGVLLVLLHWRLPGQAKWVPLLDTKLLDRLASGRKEETYWPVAVSREKFCCIILKGGEKYPYFPRPLLSEFDFKIPLTSTPVEAGLNPVQELEEKFVRESVLCSLQEDQVAATAATHIERADLARKEVAIDKILVQMLAVECKDEDKGAKALEIVSLMRQSRTLELAVKVAVKYDRMALAERISQMRGEMELDEAL